VEKADKLKEVTGRKPGGGEPENQKLSYDTTVGSAVTKFKEYFGIETEDEVLLKITYRHRDGPYNAVWQTHAEETLKLANIETDPIANYINHTMTIYINNTAKGIITF